ncbi:MULTISPECIES: M20 family metallopeptidase [Gordonia]|uniref:M20 family metallopeptidase n=2 Tax=Gordonia TaxID=2053 RepID=A0ABN3HKA8_9ACTN|nr:MULTISPECIES: M20 family metallopeptidase [Gordonia]AUH67910.1 acetylornithine deacetylase [Gordonia sp. YC-JH1]GAC60737.1 putative acetylornithine deacetylase [Gordonia sihwensis NBRC 108236]
MRTVSRDVVDALAAAVDAAEVEALTCALIAEASVNPGGSEESTVAVLADACREAGFDVEVSEAAPGRPNLIATVNGDAAGPGLMFLGHSDVVPPGPGWTGDPFVPRRDGDLIVGRGATDMKGGIAAVVAAMKVVARAVDGGVEVSGPVRLVVTVDEEEHGVGVRHLVADPPSGEYRGCIVAEPTRLEVVRGCRGASYFDVAVTGRAAHSGRPSDGASAILAAARVIELIDADQRRMAADPDPLLGYGTWNVGTIDGGQGISVVAPNCAMGVDRRLMPGEDVDEIGRRLSEEIRAAGIESDGVAVSVTPTMYLPGFATPADDPIVDATAQAVADSGAPTRVGGWTAACDGGWISTALGIPTVVMGPGDINGQAHQPDESVSLSELVTAAQAYVRVTLSLLARGG